jgi:hypothetical protein
MDIEFIALLFTILGTQAGTYALLWQQRSEIHRNQLEFAKCPLHACGGESKHGN